MRLVILGVVIAACHPSPASPSHRRPSAKGDSRWCTPYADNMAVGAGWIASADREGLHVTDLSTDATRRITDHPRVLPANLGGIVVAIRGGEGAPYEVQGVDTASGAIVWTRPGRVPEAAVAKDLLVVAFEIREDENEDGEAVSRTNIEAFATGRTGRWRASVAGKPVGVLAHGGTAYVVTEHGQASLHAFALADGRPLWRHDFPDPQRWLSGTSAIMAATDAGVALALERSIRLVAHTGTIAGELPIAASELVAHGDTVYALSSTGDGKPGRTSTSTVHAIETARRAEAWQRSLAAGGNLVHATATRVFVVSQGVLLALDTTGGDERDRRGIGYGESDVFVASPAPTFGTCDRGVMRWIDPATPLAQERAVVTGRLACRNCGELHETLDVDGLRVELHVGDTHRTFPESGPFRIELVGSGIVPVFLLDWGGRRQPLGRVELTGRGSYDLGTIAYDVWNGNE